MRWIPRPTKRIFTHLILVALLFTMRNSPNVPNEPTILSFYFLIFSFKCVNVCSALFGNNLHIRQYSNEREGTTTDERTMATVVMFMSVKSSFVLRAKIKISHSSTLSKLTITTATIIEGIYNVSDTTKPLTMDSTEQEWRMGVERNEWETKPEQNHDFINDVSHACQITKSTQHTKSNHNLPCTTRERDFIPNKTVHTAPTNMKKLRIELNMTHRTVWVCVRQTRTMPTNI